MSRRRLLGLGLLIGLASVATSYLIGKLLDVRYMAEYNGDPDIHIWVVSLLCIYQPLIALGCAATTSYMGWFVIASQRGVVLKDGFAVSLVAIVTAVVVSLVVGMAIIFT